MDENGKFTKTYMETDLKDECKTECKMSFHERSSTQLCVCSHLWLLNFQYVLDGKDECETAGKLMACVVRVMKEDRMDKMKANAEKSS